MSTVGRQVHWERYFGPYLVKTTISDELHKLLLNGANKVRNSKKLKKKNDYRKLLAGNLSEEYNYDGVFTKKQEKIVEEEFLWLASMYTKMSEQALRSKENIREPNQLVMHKPVWVNFMKAGEWNPSHSHSGDISCVTYLQVPPEIDRENKESETSKQSNTPSAGKIEFRYGEEIGYMKNGVIMTPRVKEIWLFPAKLAHLVYPFKSKVERISVSVNFADRITAARNLRLENTKKLQDELRGK